MTRQKHTSEYNKDSDTMPVYTLGIASKLSGIPAHSIRQYIDEGLLIPYKLESMRHLFSQYDIDRLKLIRNLIREKGLNFAGVRTLMATIPCWSVRDCPEEIRKACEAFSESFYPCWMASEKGSVCKNENCRDCKVYCALDEHAGVKSLIKTLL
jgi:MerR family transcriptional regulator/heat shock protein HspR